MADQTAGRDIPVLMIIDGPLRGQQWAMHGNQLVIGRGGHCDVVIPERRVSREHVRIWREGEQYFAEDLDSKNGTHLNTRELGDPRELNEGDEIQIALCVTLKFVGSEATAPLSLEDLFDSGAGLHLDERTRQVTINDRVLDPPLSLHQYRLLELLHKYSGSVCTRDEVVRAVWPDAAADGVSEQAIDALVRRLRDRLAEVSPDHQCIVTVRGHGFRLEQPPRDTNT